MVIAVVDYGAGNLRSAARALEAAGAQGVVVTQDPQAVLAADRIVLPGVGAFGACAAALRAVSGMEEALAEAVRHRGRPFLGICVGMQLMADEGHEFGTHRGLGWIGGTVSRMTPDGLKVPHIGWNDVTPAKPGIIEPGHAYFVHSYAFEPADQADIAATCHYGTTFVAAVQRDNMLGVQFHPEKSQNQGLAFLNRWLQWCP